MNAVILNIPKAWEHKHYSISDEEYKIDELPKGNYHQLFFVKIKLNYKGTYDTLYTPISNIFETKDEIVKLYESVYKNIKYIPTPLEQQHLDNILEKHFTELHQGYLFNKLVNSNDNDYYKEIYTYKYKHKLWLIDSHINNIESFSIKDENNIIKNYLLKIVKGVNHTTSDLQLNLYYPILVEQIREDYEIDVTLDELDIKIMIHQGKSNKLFSFVKFIASEFVINFIKNEFDPYSISVNCLLKEWGFSNNESKVISNIIKNNSSIGHYFINTVDDVITNKLMTFILFYHEYRGMYRGSMYGYLRCIRNVKFYNDAYIIRNIEYIDELLNINKIKGDKEYLKKYFKIKNNDEMIEVDNFINELNYLTKDFGL